MDEVTICIINVMIIMIHYYHHQTNIPIVIETTQYSTFSGWKVIGIGNESSLLLSDHTCCLLTIAHNLELIAD